MRKNTTHYILGDKSDWFCECKKYCYGRKPCKHIKQIENITEIKSKLEQIMIHKVTIDRCNDCDSENIVRNGI